MSSATKTSRTIGVVIVVAGGLTLLSLVAINPFVAELLFPRVYVKRLAVIGMYLTWAGGIGGGLILLGLLTYRLRSAGMANAALLLFTLSLIVLADRLLLVIIGLPLWIHDPQIHYRHRPGAVSVWPETYGYKPIRINSYGYHDDEFPVAKPPGEFRAVMLGDSVTMGHGVTAAETYSNQLERMIAARRPAAPRSSKPGSRVTRRFRNWCCSGNPSSSGPISSPSVSCSTT